MRRLLWLMLALLPTLATAQEAAVPRAKGTITVDTAPTGSCDSALYSRQFRKVKATGEEYACVGGTWTLVTEFSNAGITTGTLGPRGASADASGDNTADNPLWPTLERSGQQPIYVTPSGLGTVRGLPDRGIEPVMVVGFDEHDWDDTANIARAKAACDTYKIPCTIWPMRNTDRTTYPTSADLQAWTAAGHEVGNHGDYHVYGGYDSVDGNPKWQTNNGRLTSPGTATCTNGSTTVTGTSTTFTALSVTPGQDFVCDYENNGGIGGTDRLHAIPICSIQSATQLTLCWNYAGTTSSPARPYEIRSGPTKAVNELKNGQANLRSIFGNNYVTGWQNDPGNFEPCDDACVAAKAALDIPASSIYSNTQQWGGNGWGVTWGAAVNPARITMNFPSCQYATLQYQQVVDYVMKERLFFPWNFEEVKTDAGCTGSGSYIGQTAFEGLLAYIAAKRDAGLLRVMGGDEAARYVRSIPQPAYGVNALRNYSMQQVGDGLTPTTTAGTGAYSLIPGWIGIDTDSATSGIQHSGKTTTWTGDGNGVLTATRASGTETDYSQQFLTLLPATNYVGGATLDCSAMTAGSAGISLLDSGNVVSHTDDMINTLDPIWFSQNVASANQWKYNTLVSSPLCAAGDQTRIIFYFRTPDVWNEGIGLQLTVSSFTGTVRFKDVSITPTLPISFNSAWGQGAGIKNYRVSRAAPAETSGMVDAAFVDEWNPAAGNYDSDFDGTTDTAFRQDIPTVNVYSRAYRAADSSRQETFRETVTAKGAVDAKTAGRVIASAALGIGGTNSDANDTNRLCIRRLTTCNAAGDGGGAIECLLYDMDCDGTEDTEDWCTYENAGTVTNDADC